MAASQELGPQELRVGSGLGTKDEKSDSIPDSAHKTHEHLSKMDTAEGTADREDQLAEQHNLKRA